MRRAELVSRLAALGASVGLLVVVLRLSFLPPYDLNTVGAEPRAEVLGVQLLSLLALGSGLLLAGAGLRWPGVAGWALISLGLAEFLAGTLLAFGIYMPGPVAGTYSAPFTLQGGLLGAAGVASLGGRLLGRVFLTAYDQDRARAAPARTP